VDLQLKPFEEPEAEPSSNNEIKKLDSSEFKELMPKKLLEHDLYADLLDEP